MTGAEYVVSNKRLWIFAYAVVKRNEITLYYDFPDRKFPWVRNTNCAFRNAIKQKAALKQIRQLSRYGDCIPIVCYRYLYNTQRENASVELTYASRRGII